MNEILAKLLESELLSEDSKAQLTESFNSAVETLREEVAAEVRVELTEQFVKAQDKLVEAVDKMLTEQVDAELAELHADINDFRDLETEKEIQLAEKIVEEKERMAGLLAEQIDDLVSKIDLFLEKVVEEEFEELNEDIEDVKRLQFGRKIFEAMESEYRKFRKADLSSVEQELAEAKDRLADANSRLEEIEVSSAAAARAEKIDGLLEGVEGLARDQFKVLLSNTPLEKLDEAFKKYAPRVLRESIEAKAAGKEPKVIVENKVNLHESKIVTGNDKTDEEAKGNQGMDAELARMRRLAGITA